MRNLLLIAKREYLANVRSKAFIIGLIIAPVFMGGSIIAMALLQDRVDTTDRTISIIDHTGTIADHLIVKAEERNEKDVYDKDGKKKKPLYLFEKLDQIPEDSQRLKLELSDKVRNGEIFGFSKSDPTSLTRIPALLRMEKTAKKKRKTHSNPKLLFTQRTLPWTTSAGGFEAISMTAFANFTSPVSESIQKPQDLFSNGTELKEWNSWKQMSPGK